MDVRYINPFITATSNVFETMLKVRYKVGKPYLKRPNAPADPKYRIMPAIQLTGPVMGMVVLQFPERVALALVNALTGGAAQTLDADALDAVGEITNMIVGGAKKDLPGGQISISVPMIFTGQQIPYPRSIPIIVIPFAASGDSFLIEAALCMNPSPPLSADAETTTDAEAAALADQMLA
jgi:chemotaxis protein CheX